MTKFHQNAQRVTKIYFPQWQGSGNGMAIEQGAQTILEYLDDENIIHIPLSDAPSGANGKQQHHINNFDAINQQLSGFKSYIKRAHPTKIQVIGGDCGLEIVPVSYLNKKYPNLGVIWFDAHADINRPCDSPSWNFHGMPLRTLLGDGEPAMKHLLFSKLHPSQIHYVGLRDIDTMEQEFIAKENIYAPRKLNTENLIHTLHQKEITHVYLHFDFDCLEPGEYDKTYYQVPDGLSIQESENCVKALQKNFEVVGSSVLESIAKHQDGLAPITGIIEAFMK